VRLNGRRMNEEEDEEEGKRKISELVTIAVGLVVEFLWWFRHRMMI
jgi:hypothetical protein